jgi:hypothetical protein
VKTQANPDRRLESRVQEEMAAAFQAKLPGILDHCLRLTVERLQIGLMKDADTDLKRVETWPLQPHEIQALAQAIEQLNRTRAILPR